MRLTHLSLFSGIGGLDLAAEMAGFATVGQCEWADYPTKVLEKHWPDVPRWRDIRTLTGESFYEKTGLRTVDVVSGGFPCQPFSQAGKQRGKEDDRYLWPEMLRVITDLRPSWVLGENVPGIVNLALDQVLFDLEAAGYTAQPFIIPACGVDAPHRRDRVAIVANTQSIGIQGVRPDREQERGAVEQTGVSYGESDVCEESAMGNAAGARLSHRVGEQMEGSTGEQEPKRSGGDVPDADDRRGAVRRDWELQTATETERGRSDIRRRAQELVTGQWWPAEPGVGRMAHGIPNRVDRLKCLGNAVVPQQFYPFFKAIADIESKTTKGETP